MPARMARSGALPECGLRPEPSRWNRLGVAGARRPGARNTGDRILPPQATAALAAARRRRQKASPSAARPVPAA